MRGRTGKGREARFFRFPATALPVQVQRDFLSRTTRADSAAPLTCLPKVLELPGLGKRKGRKCKSKLVMSAFGNVELSA